MATILAWLHRRQRVIHRDVKLENFMVTSRSDGGVLLRLIDFGYASPVSQPREQGFGTDVWLPAFVMTGELTFRFSHPFLS